MCNFCVGLDPTLVGLSMIYAINLIGLLQFTVRTSAEMEDLVGMGLRQNGTSTGKFM